MTSSTAFSTTRRYRCRDACVFLARAFPFLALACTDATRTTPTGSTSDSAGIQIVVNRVPTWKAGDEWKITADPTFIIGGATDDRPDRIFHEINSAFRLSNGTTFVVDHSDQHVRIFDSAGKLIRTAGRAGDGPGEFSTIWRTFRLAGDTIVVTGERRDVTWLTGSGDLVRGFSPADVYSTAFAMFIDGGIVAVPLKAGPGMRAPTPAEMSGRGSKAKAYYSTYHIADRDGKSVHDLGRFEYSKRTGGAFELLYGARLYQVARERYYLGYGEEYSIKVFDRKGKLAKMVRREVPVVPVSKEEEEYAREIRRQRTPKGGVAEEELPFLEPSVHHPFFSEILVDGAEHLWVREYRKHEDGIDRSIPQPREGGQPQRFNIFDPDGHWLGSVEAPNQLQITDIGADYIAGIWRDADLVESVRVYGLTRGRAGANRD